MSHKEVSRVKKKKRESLGRSENEPRGSKPSKEEKMRVSRRFSSNEQNY